MDGRTALRWGLDRGGHGGWVLESAPSPPGMFKGPVSSLLPSTRWVPAQALGPGRTQNSFVGAERGEGPPAPQGLCELPG